jgi:hypothetical protein
MAYKTFTAGSVLTASDVMTYLMKQTVIVCTSGTRPSGPNEGMTIFETDTDRVLIYTGSAWSPVAATGTATPRCAASRGATQSIANNTANVLVSWSVETYDVGAMFSATSTTLATIPSGWGGLYLITTSIEFAPAATGYRGVQINTGGSTRVRQTVASVGSGPATRVSLATVWNLAAGDTVTVGLFQDSGGALNINNSDGMPMGSVHYLSPTP